MMRGMRRLISLQLSNRTVIASQRIACLIVSRKKPDPPSVRLVRLLRSVTSLLGNVVDTVSAVLTDGMHV